MRRPLGFYGVVLMCFAQFVGITYGISLGHAYDLKYDAQVLSQLSNGTSENTANLKDCITDYALSSNLGKDSDGYDFVYLGSSYLGKEVKPSSGIISLQIESSCQFWIETYNPYVPGSNGIFSIFQSGKKIYQYPNILDESFFGQKKGDIRYLIPNTYRFEYSNFVNVSEKEPYLVCQNIPRAVSKNKLFDVKFIDKSVLSVSPAASRLQFYLPKVYRLTVDCTKEEQERLAVLAIVAAGLKAKQEAEAKAAAELKAKQEAEAKAAAIATANKKTTITCAKGKLTKKVTAVKPKCPSGYKVKK